MSNPLHAAYYADRAVQRTVPVVDNVQIAQSADANRQQLCYAIVAVSFTIGLSTWQRGHP